MFAEGDDVMSQRLAEDGQTIRSDSRELKHPTGAARCLPSCFR